MKKFFYILAILGALAAAVTLVLVNLPVVNDALAFSQSVEDGLEATRGPDTNIPTNLFDIGGGTDSIFTTIVNILLFIIGAIAVIMIIIGGIRYVVSGGNASAVSAAKNTILYAIIGVIIAVLAFAIVNFVLDGLLEGAGGGGGGGSVDTSI